MLCPTCHLDQPPAVRCSLCGAVAPDGIARAAIRPDPGPLPPSVPVDAAFDNPYQAPRCTETVTAAAAHAGAGVLATRSTRLAAALMDYLCLLVVVLPILGAIWYTADHQDGVAAALSVASVVAATALGAVQALLIVRDGQTIGKKLLRIRIVDVAGGQVPPWHRVLAMRYLLNLALRQIPFYYVVDVCLIFGQEQRCVHDYLAGTKVVDTRA